MSDLASTPAVNVQPASVVTAAPGEEARPAGDARQQFRRLAYWVVATDSLCILAAFVLAYGVAFGFQRPQLDFLLVMVIAPPLWIGLFGVFHLYGMYRFTPAEEFSRLVSAITVGIMVVVAGSFWSKTFFSRFWTGLTWALSLVLILSSRRLWHLAMSRMKARGRLTFRTLIVGTNDEAAHLAAAMRPRRFGFAAVGFVSTGNGVPQVDGLPVVGEVEGLRQAIRETDAECVVVASSALSAEQMRRVAKAIRLEGVEVRVSANLPETLSTRVSPQPLGGVMTLSLRPVQLSGSQAAIKRTLDVMGSSVGLLISLPAFAAIALGIKLTSRGPVFYRQERIGRRGAHFRMLKFRTMVVGADRMRNELRERNNGDGRLFKMQDDPRVHRVGRWLRRWSLDEVPQLWNVLKGEMSLVGPRPSLPEEVELYEEWHFDRLEVRPGITGLWQVSGRSQLSFDDYVRLDVFYIENWSIAYDLFILAKTPAAVLSGRGSY